MSYFFELGEGGLCEEDFLDDLASDVVSHSTLVTVRPESSPMDVSGSKLRWNLLAPHVFPRVFPC